MRAANSPSEGQFGSGWRAERLTEKIQERVGNSEYRPLAGVLFEREAEKMGPVGETAFVC